MKGKALFGALVICGGKMTLDDFDYNLPEELIAQTPLEKRDMSRLLVYRRDGKSIEHKKFYDICGFLNPGDCLVLNNTRVIPARLLGVKEGSMGAAEVVLLKELGDDCWEAIVRPGKRIKKGCRLLFANGKLKAEVTEHLDDGNRVLKFFYDGIWQEVLDEAGITPLPPYIHEELKDKERYQTVYSKIKGSAAAPTAGLHFTRELLDEIEQKGVETAYITLHVGLGTFRPVKENVVEEHKMHSEFYNVDEATAEKINRCRNNGGRIVCVGTTSCRVLETVADDKGIIHSGHGETDIFIYPGYKFNAVDALITNFHLPRSTLLMLISALAGREEVLRFYEEAIREKYRFFSFGDACFIC